MKRIVSVVLTVVLFAAVFTGALVVTSAESQGKLVEGDIILETPVKTTDKAAEITDGSGLAEGIFTLGWEAYDGADSYSIRIFLNIANEDTEEGVDFRYIGEVTSKATSVTVGDLTPNWRYTVVVYALDAEGNEIVTYDRIPVATIPPLKDKKDEPQKEGVSLLTIVITVVAAVLVIAAVVITVILVATKPKSHRKSSK